MLKLNDLFKFTCALIFLLFLSLYFTTLGGYYEYNLSKKNTLTEEAIKRFEEDVKAGKQIIASNYITTPTDYSNKATKVATKVSNTISDVFNAVMKFVFKELNNMINT